MQRWMLAAVLCVVATTGCQSKPTKDADVDAVKAWLAAWTVAYTHQDLAAIKALYAPEVVAYDLTPPLQFASYDAYMKGYAEYFASVHGTVSIETRDVHVATSGDLAYLAFLQHVTTAENGKSTGTWMRVTTVLKKENGKWLDVHDHVSVPTDLATGKSMLDLKP